MCQGQNPRRTAGCGVSGGPLPAGLTTCRPHGYLGPVRASGSGDWPSAGGVAETPLLC
jgi:hypothetical protein